MRCIAEVVTDVLPVVVTVAVVWVVPMVREVVTDVLWVVMLVVPAVVL